jgi:hypothetical protein
MGEDVFFTGQSPQHAQSKGLIPVENFCCGKVLQTLEMWNVSR